MSVAHARIQDTELKKRGGDLVAARIVTALREEILTRGEGAFLGSEEELLSRYGVSRPTFRQTARVLENEQLLTVKRGIGGGYYARRPSMHSVGRAAATYLRSRNTSLLDLVEATGAASRAIARLAAQSTDETAREALRQQYERMRALCASALSQAEFHAEDREMASRLGALSGNAPLELFVATLYQVGMDDTRIWIFERKPERLVEYQQRRLQLVEAVLARDPEVAEVLQERTNRMMVAWLQGDLEKLRTDEPAPRQDLC